MTDATIDRPTYAATPGALSFYSGHRLILRIDLSPEQAIRLAREVLRAAEERPAKGER